MRPVLYTFGLFASAAMLIFVDYSPSDLANQVSLLVLILGAATLGIAAPRWAWLAALILGGSLAAMLRSTSRPGFRCPTRCHRLAGLVQPHC